ncbi:alpha/beta fold hydrolase [Spirosoma harenae]
MISPIYSSMRLRPFFHYLSIFFLFFCAGLYAQPTAKTKEAYKYLLYLPKNYASEKSDFPLVIYLHGSSHRGQDLAKLKSYGLPQLVEQGQDFDFIIASPQCPNGKFWSTDNWFEPLFEELKTKYRIDPKRVYLTGISMGGYGVWQTALEYPDKFAAIVPLCGGCDDSTKVCQIRHIPIWTFHGTTDYVIPINETERLVKRLNTCGGQVKFTRLEGEGHGIQYLYKDKTIYDWLLEQRKQN